MKILVQNLKYCFEMENQVLGSRDPDQFPVHMLTERSQERLLSFSAGRIIPAE